MFNRKDIWNAHHKERACVIIPIYKVDLRDFERASFSQCLSVLLNYDIHIITYKQLPIEEVISQFDVSNNNLFIDYFKQDYFTDGIKGYNKLMMEASFYKKYLRYEYMLIYQLDAYVFKDELEYWCNKGYDYIGAPWINEVTFEFWGVGNGGFSLRKVAYYYSILSSHRPLMKKKFGEESIWKYIGHVLGIHNNINYYKKYFMGNEDMFLSGTYLKNAYQAPVIPTLEEASLFSLEKAPSYLYEKNGRKLPFGCHAFNRNEFNEFWSRFIKY